MDIAPVKSALLGNMEVRIEHVFCVMASWNTAMLKAPQLVRNAV